MASTPPPANESPAQRQARLRRERRQAKLQAEGQSRLDKILSSSGRQAVVEDVSSVVDVDGAEAPESLHERQAVEENDRSEPEGARTSQQTGENGKQEPEEMSEAAYEVQMAQLRQLLRQQQPQPGEGSSEPSSASGQADPMMQMLSNMLGVPMPGPDTSAGDFQLGLEQKQEQEQAETSTRCSSSTYVWRILHFVLIMTLSLYLVLTTSLSASTSPSASTPAYPPFLLFSTLELLLQGTRFFVEKFGGAQPPPQSGFVDTLVASLPEPWRSTVDVVKRYRRIWSTVVEDAGLVIWVLGVMSWWTGRAN